MATPNKRKAFVLMPFALEFDDVFTDLVSPALTEYEVARADTRLDKRGILEKIVCGIFEADLIVVDLTGNNPNVLYELGVAHALNKPTVLISQDDSALPFDIRAYPIQPYSTHFKRAPDLTRHLRLLGDAHIAGTVEFGNPVRDFLPETEPARVVLPRVSPTTDFDYDYGVADFTSDLETGGLSIHETVLRLAQHVAALDDELRSIVSRLREPTSATSAGSAARKRALATEAAEAIELYARDTVAALPELRESWARYQRASFWLLRSEQWPQTDTKSRDSFVLSVKQMAERVTSAIGSTAEFKTSLMNLGFISGDVARSVDEVGRVLDSVISEFVFAKSVVTRVLELAGESPTEPTAD